MEQPEFLSIDLGNGLELSPKPSYKPERNPVWSVSIPPSGLEGLSPAARSDAEEARQALSKLGINPDEKIFDTIDATEQNVEAFNDLGLIRDREEARDSILQQMEMLSAILTRDGISSEVSPFISLTVRDEGLTLAALVMRYNLGRRQNPGKTPFAVMDLDFWKGYKAHHINQRTLEKDKIYDPGVISYPLAMLSGDGRNGLSLTRQTADEQKATFNNHRRKYNDSHENTQILLLNPVDYLIINAIRRLRGEELIDYGGLGSTTRFITMPTRPVERESYTYNDYPGGSYENTSKVYRQLSLKHIYDSKSKGNGVRFALAPSGHIEKDTETEQAQKIAELTSQMTTAANNLEFEKAADLRDLIAEVKQKL